MRIALGIEYDGSRYKGWQSQPDVPNVQDILQAALQEISGISAPVAVIAAGRTDTGVHALEQVVHFDTEVERPLSAWVRGCNALLPRDVAVLWAHPVSEEFHARFSAQARSYQYVLMNRPIRSAVHHQKVGWFHLPLDVNAMREASDYLLGKQDFSAFRSSECQAKSPVKQITHFSIAQQGETLIFDVTADAFLHHMVRNIIGCLVYVGKGRYPPEWIKTVLAGKDRKHAAPTFAPDGLYFRHVTYDAKWGLPQGKMAARKKLGMV